MSRYGPPTISKSPQPRRSANVKLATRSKSRSLSPQPGRTRAESGSPNRNHGNGAREKKDFLTTGEVAASKQKAPDYERRPDKRAEEKHGNELYTERIFVYNDTRLAWEKLHAHSSNPQINEPYIRDGKTPCSNQIRKVSLAAKSATDFKLMKAWLRAKSPNTDHRPGSSAVVPAFSDVKTKKDEEQPTCYHCNQGFNRLVKCRVCGRYIHTPKCIFDETNGDLVVTATALRCHATGFVWSCPTCENLLSMMSDDDMIDLMEAFDELDMDSDSMISLDDYVKYKEKIHKTKHKKPMSLHETEVAVEEFQRLDKSKSGRVDWWSFIDSNIIEKLSSRRKSELVKFLTDCEIAEAKELFLSFDSDADGKITLREAEKTYERWFSSLWSKVLNCPDTLTGPKKNEELSKLVGDHVHVNVQILMEADYQNQGAVSWEQFLRDQAIYILAARRNPSNLYKIPPKEDEMKVIEEETSYNYK